MRHGRAAKHEKNLVENSRSIILSGPTDNSPYAALNVTCHQSFRKKQVVADRVANCAALIYVLGSGVFD